MKQFVSIVGNRPQLIKLDPEFEQKIIYSGQHYDKELKDFFFEGLNIPEPDEDLGETELGKMIDKMVEVLPKYDPHYVIVYGDTRTTVAGAVAAHQLGIPVIHVEAGCRSGNNKQIEERNRKLVDKIASIHLAPSFKSIFNLKDEGLGENAYNVGCSNFSSLMKTLPTERKREESYNLLTIHRAENTNSVDKLCSIFEGLSKSKNKIIFPIHPRTKKVIDDNEIIIPYNIEVIDPLCYRDFVHEMGHADVVITDSGGVQAEAYFLRTPCITLREETEWKETIDEGWNVLVGTNTEKIINNINTFRPRKQTHNSYAYGKGLTHKSIRGLLKNL